MLKSKLSGGDRVKYYENLIELGCFSRQQLVELVGNDASAASIIRDYLHKGYIERIRHDLYATISLETQQPIPSRYQIGNALFPDACITHHSAFEVFGYANQVFYDTYVSTLSRFQEFEYNGVIYHRVAPSKSNAVCHYAGVKVSALEQTVVDSINDFEKIGGLEETLRCLLLVPTLDEAKLLDALAEYNNGFLYQKCGYLLQGLSRSISLSSSFFIECRKHISNSKRYLLKDKGRLVWNAEWRLYSYSSLKSLIDKGVNDYDTI